MKIDSKKIGQFLLTINDLDYHYMCQIINLRNSIANLIKGHNLTKEYVCEKFGIPISQYNNFTKGNYNYNFGNVAILNALYCELEALKLEETVPVQVAKKEEQ